MMVLHPVANQIILHATYAELKAQFGMTYPVGKRSEDLQAFAGSLDRLVKYLAKGYVPERDREFFMDANQYVLEINEVPVSDTELRIEIVAQTHEGEPPIRGRRVFEFADWEDVLDCCHALAAELPESRLLRMDDAYLLEFVDDLSPITAAHLMEYADIPEALEAEVLRLGTVLIAENACRKLRECFSRRTEDRAFWEHVQHVADWVLHPFDEDEGGVGSR